MQTMSRQAQYKGQWTVLGVALPHLLRFRCPSLPARHCLLGVIVAAARPISQKLKPRGIVMPFHRLPLHEGAGASLRFKLALRSQPVL